MIRRALALLILALLAGSCLDNPFDPSNWPSGASSSGAGGSAASMPCGAAPCDDGAGGQLQDVGEHCGGDDDHAPLPGVVACCHGLVCVDPETGAFPGSCCMGLCYRPGLGAGPPVCSKNGPGSWLYQCTGTYVPIPAYLSQNVVVDGQFTGPPPSTFPGGTGPGTLGPWMQAKFFALFPYLTALYTPQKTKAGATYALLKATGCHPLGPAVGP